MTKKGKLPAWLNAFAIIGFIGALTSILGFIVNSISVVPWWIFASSYGLFSFSLVCIVFFETQRRVRKEIALDFP
jgi:hypothetical protein